MRGGMFAAVLGVGLLVASSNAMAQDNVAPCPVYDLRTFIVYFGPEPENLLPDSLPVIEALADFYVENPPGRRCSYPIESIKLVGHTDTAGDAMDNLRLSKKRADFVADELVRLGVPRDVISVEFKGEAEPAVHTADNVSEPLNNRVTMDPIF